MMRDVALPNTCAPVGPRCSWKVRYCCMALTRQCVGQEVGEGSLHRGGIGRCPTPLHRLRAASRSLRQRATKGEPLSHSEQASHSVCSRRWLLAARRKLGSHRPCNSASTCLEKPRHDRQAPLVNAKKGGGTKDVGLTGAHQHKRQHHGTPPSCLLLLQFQNPHLKDPKLPLLHPSSPKDTSPPNHLCPATLLQARASKEMPRGVAVNEAARSRIVSCDIAITVLPLRQSC